MNRPLPEKLPGSIRIFLGGPVSTGRGIDQLFPTHNSAEFGKPDNVPASRYLEASFRLHGAPEMPVVHSYVWGKAIPLLDQARTDFRLVNLETPITSRTSWEKKQYTYRMHPANIACLTAACIDCCSLANNHVLDFGPGGLADTLDALKSAGVGWAGAGKDAAGAQRPHTHCLPDGRRILVFSWAFRDSHIAFPHWAAWSGRAGINFLQDADPASASQMLRAIQAWRQPGDVVIASLHWGANWVRKIPAAHRALARHLIDLGAVDVIHGHSSHHVLPCEIYRGKPVLYGCGDLINDTEGVPEYRARSGHLGALYFVDLDAETLRVRNLRARPFERRRLRLEPASPEDARRVLHALRGLHGPQQPADQH
jgi:poly-gamma-glutamate capsule biosynthesis protein CapA/YwtB (metallophosphatase superfamily)